jgi:hypothetical protein
VFGKKASPLTDDLHEKLGWADGAEQLGWTLEELFGLHPDAPIARYDRMGLL